MAQKFRNKILLAKVETTYGTDADPDGETNAILTRDLEVQLMQGDTADREVDRSTFGNFQTFHVGPHTRLTFQVELAGSGTAGTAPAYGPLLRACGLAETTDASSVDYTLISSGEESVTLHYYQGGILHTMVGCRGTVSIALSPGSLPYYQFEFWGLRVPPEDASFPTADFTEFQAPEAVNNAHTGSFTFDDWSGTLTAFEVDLAQDVQYRNVVGTESVQIVDRRPAGSMTVEEPLLATKDLHAIIANHEPKAIAITHGSTAGNQIEITGPKVQIVSPQIGDSQGIKTLQTSLRWLPDEGDDELKIRVQ